MAERGGRQKLGLRDSWWVEAADSGAGQGREVEAAANNRPVTRSCDILQIIPRILNFE